MNINELIERAHSQAKAMGWWDEPRNTGELLMLIVSECGEALEAHRSGRLADLKSFDECMAMGPYTDDTFPIVFQGQVKDTFEDELADIVIRIADLMGYLDHTFKNYDLSKKSDKDNVGEALLSTCSFICSGNSGGYNLPGLDAALLSVFWLANKHNIDLWRHIDLKLKYNLTRGTRHGKKY